MAVSEDVARRYLLGQLPDDEQTAVERDYLANDGAFEELLAVEDDLADEYASGRLSGEERRAFEQRITISPRIAEKVQFARALDSVAAGAHRPARRVSGWLAAACVLLLALSAWSIARVVQLRRDVARLTAEGATATDRERDLRQQLDRAQSAIQSATAPAFTTLLLSPGLVRESGSVARAQLAVGATSLRLILSVPGAVRPAYRVRVETAEGTGVWIDDHPRPVPATSGTAIETVVPIDRLKPGDYVVVVEGVADYAFRIPSPR